MKKSGLAFWVLATLPVVASLPSFSGLPSHLSGIAPARIAYAQPRSWYETHVNLAEPERERIQRHLAETEAVMRRHPPAGLTVTQMKNRLARLDDLHEYWARGEFPQNRDFPDRLIPYFIDAEGVPCAMGHLVIQSGGVAFAEEIRTTRNNAYIGEIAAVDGRLAAWGEENGITLEEAARVQPGYGPPRLTAVQQVGLDSLSRPWAFGHDANVIGNSFALFYRQNLQWTLHSNGGSPGFCLTNGGQPLTFTGGAQVVWKERTYTYSGTTFSVCAWSANSVDAWMGTRSGLHRLRRTGSVDTLARTRFTTSLASDTVTGVAASSNAVWAATPRGIYRRGLVGSDTTVTAWDSASFPVGGANITGLKASGNQVWAGISGNSIQTISGTFNFFSTRGLRRYVGTGSGWAAYRMSTSSIQAPNDTVYALAIRDTSSVWVATRQGFARFNLTTTVKVADIPAGVTVYDMVGNTSGFYAGTSNGVYQFANDSLVWLGQPAVSVRPGIAGKRPTLSPRLRVLSSRDAQNNPQLRAVTGRKAGTQPGTGVYVVEPEASR